MRGVPKGGKPLGTAFRLKAKCFFLTYKGTSQTGEKIDKQALAKYLLQQNPNDKKIKPQKYLVCQQMYDSGQPHFHVILTYPVRKEITTPDSFDYLKIHPNIQTMRNLKAAFQYVYKEDPNPVTNMDVIYQRKAARAKDTSSLYQLLEQEMRKDPQKFDVMTWCSENNLTKEIYKANYSKALRLLKLEQQAYCNRMLASKPGFKYIDRPLIQSQLTPSELEQYDSWSGYQIIVDHLNQIPTWRFRRPVKTKNLMITGKPNTGKSALFWQTYPKPPLNPLNSHVSVYPMGLKNWFPSYKSEVYSAILWNETKLTNYSYDIILQLLDGNPVALPDKGTSHNKLDNPIVLMTSNLTLDQLIQQKFRCAPHLIPIARENLGARITSVKIPKNLTLFILQKLFVPETK